MREIKPNTYYRHFKGAIMKVLFVAKDSETLEDLVVYEHDKEYWVRPKEMFLSEVDHKKYPDIKQKYRFEEVDIESVK